MNDQAHTVIDLSTFAGLLEQNHKLDCWCPGCRRWAACNLAELVRNGLGQLSITDCRPTCRKCGSRGEWQVKPPLPQFDGATWMQK